MKLALTPVSIMNLFLMLGLSIVLAVDYTLFENNDIQVYNFLLKIAPQGAYAVTCFVICVVLFSAFVLRNKFIEMIGLFLSGVFTLFVLSGYLLTFPNITTVMTAIWTLASFMTIVEVQESRSKSATLKGGDQE